MTKLKALIVGWMLRYYWLTCLYYVYSNEKEKRRYRKGQLSTNSGMIHLHASVSEMADYAREVFQDYKRYGQVDRFFGRMAESGPGESCGVGLHFVADGCGQVDLVDRFYSNRNPQILKQVYQKIVEQNPSLKLVLKDADLGDETTFPGVNRYYGPQAAGETFFQKHRDYDFIISRSVMEHMEDPLTSLLSMADALKPGGMMLHKVDFRDHGQFSKNFHELKFLETPRWLHRLMTQGTGGVNRILIDQYRKVLVQSGLDYTIYITRLAGGGDIIPHQPLQEIDSKIRRRSLDYIATHRKKFAHEFRALTDEDLAVAGIFIVARRPLAS